MESLLETFGADTVEQTKRQLEARFGEYPRNLRMFLDQLDSRIAEMYQEENIEGIETYQKLECFLLANQFDGQDK